MTDNTERNKEQPEQWTNPNQATDDDQNQMNDLSSATSQSMSRSQDEGQNIPEDPSAKVNPSPSPKEVNQAVLMDNPGESESRKAGAIPTSPITVKDTELPWFGQEEINDLQSRWKSIQSQFVEEPCSAVEQGETLVAETAERVKQMLSDHQQSLSQQWLNHDDISTEELRITLLNYRSLLNRILKL